ncbi:oligopeptide:H+ symporter [Actinomycetes bacterium KLBMP 9797]
MTTERTFLGQPRWFGTLFVVDMWERFSFYGMLAILYLYLVATPAEGGLGMSTGDAAALSGLYLALVFMAALPGGWVADRLLGARKATLYGGLFIAAGHACLAVPTAPALYPGLGLIVVGTGLVKPSMAAMVGDIYRGHPERREAAFSLFYMSIQVSALIAPVVTGYTAERIDWHLGFGIAAVGMLFGLAHYVIGLRHLDGVGALPANPLPPAARARVLRRAAGWGGGPALLLCLGVASGLLGFRQVLAVVGVLVLAVPIAYFVVLLRRPAMAPHRDRLRAFAWMLAASAVFWMLFAQVPALLNLFAKESVARTVAGFEVPASWFQSVQPLFLLALAPLFAALWLRLGGRVGAPPKFAVGLACGALAFGVMAVAAAQATRGPVSALWLLTVYLLIVCGELVIAPVGLSLAAEVAPRGFTSQILGLFWLFAALGVASGGQVARIATAVPDAAYYLALAAASAVAAAGVAVAARVLTRRLATPHDAPADRDTVPSR